MGYPFHFKQILTNNSFLFFLYFQAPPTLTPPSNYSQTTIATSFETVTMPTLLSNGSFPSDTEMKSYPWQPERTPNFATKSKNLSDSMPSFILRPSTNMACQHIVTTYVIPNFLHFTAYLMGFWYFRIQENEQLYALMEKVFLHATPLQGRMVSQSNMIRRMR